MTTDRTIIHVVGAAIFDGPRCLVTQRSATMANPLLWEFPGGKIEPGESPQEALRREIAEELGLEIEVGAFIARGEAPAGATRTVRLDVYQARAVGGALRLREHAAHRWMHPRRFDTIPFAEADHPAVSALMSAPTTTPQQECPMKLYTNPLSSNARRVDLLVAHLGVELETELVDLRAGVQRSPEYRALNPNGKVPMLVDGDFVLWESNAILTYLAAINPEAGLLGSTPRERANIERWLFWQSNHLGRTADVLFFERGLKKLFGMGDPDEAVVAKQLQRFAAEAAVLNDQLDGQDFVCGALSVADFSLVTSMELLFAAGADLQPFPNILAWFGRCQALPGFIPHPSAG